MTVPDKEQLIKAFENILANKDIAKAALANPGQALADQGVEVNGIDVFNQYIFELWPDLKKHLLAASRGKETPPFMVSCSKPTCYVCVVGTTATAGAAIAACVAAEEETGCMTALAKVLSVAVSDLQAIFSECGGNVPCIIEKVCGC
jgi:hypothetical protein